MEQTEEYVEGATCWRGEMEQTEEYVEGATYWRGEMEKTEEYVEGATCATPFHKIGGMSDTNSSSTLRVVLKWPVCDVPSN